MMEDAVNIKGRPHPAALTDWLVRFIIVMLLMFTFLVGVYVGGVALHDPDTCWLLALGRWIVDHRAWPAADPFSFTYALTNSGQAPVLYQWLSEVLFYLIYRAAGLTGLLFAVAALLTYAFLVLPLWFLRQSGVSILFAILLSCLAVLSASFHFLARPEIFSYLFLGFWMILIGRLEFHELKEWKLLTFAFLLMVLWCNLHSGFVIGIIVLIIYLPVKAVEGKLAAVAVDSSWQTAVKMLLCSLAASLCTPWGAALWQYLPHLFFMRSNRSIVELSPLTGADLGEFTYYPYLVLSLVVVGLILWRSRQRGWRSVGFFAVALVIICGPAAICCKRLMPFSALLLLAAVGYMYRRERATLGAEAGAAQPKPAQLPDSVSFLRSCDEELARFYHPAAALFSLVMPTLAMIGAFLVALRIAVPTLPQSSSVFNPPFAAIRYLSATNQSGRILNDPQFGDVMIWQMQPLLPVFIDTRFDMYGDRLVQDYQQIVDCRGDWLKLLDRYRIDLVFLNPKAKLTSCLQLGRVPGGWSEIYRDQAAVIFHRTNGRLK